MTAVEEKAKDIVDEWRMGWFNQDDYRPRAIGVDANMRVSLAGFIAKAIREAEARGMERALVKLREEISAEPALGTASKLWMDAWLVKQLTAKDSTHGS